MDIWGWLNPSAKVGRANFQKIQGREWRLWAASGAITLLLTAGLLSFFLPGVPSLEDFHSLYVLPIAVRGLVALVFLFDLYVVYQQLLIYRMGRHLIEREALFRLISENVADLIAIVDMDGKRLYNSVSYEKVLGYSLSELQGSSGFDQVHPHDRELVMAAASEARRTASGQSLEYRMRHKDGAWLTFESTSSVVRNAKGEPDRMVIVNRNITERKRTEEALSRSEASFRSVVEDAPYGIYRANIDGKFLQVNPGLQRMLGYESVADLLQADLATDIFRHAGEYQRIAGSLAASHEIKDVEMEWKKRDGTPIIVRCSGHTVNGPSGNFAYFEVFAEDVTERRALEAQLRMAQKMEAIGRLSGGVAHDFNNLLGVIIGYSGVLKKSMRPEEPNYDHAVQIESAGQRAAALTRQLLAFSRQQVLTPSVLNLNSLVADMQKMLGRLLGEDVAVVLDLDQELGTVKADQSQIEQVMMNLAVNARDAMPTGGELKIRTGNVDLDRIYTRDHPGAKVGSYVLLEIVDTGMGMQPETIARVFEPFFTTKELGKGTGLGLATVYGIVKQSNGYVWVESTPGKGSSFQIYLPRLTDSVAATPPKPAAGETQGGSESILLAEDADSLRDVTRSFLEGAGFRVVCARSGEEALEIAASHGSAFDILVTDVVMTGMNGRVLSEKLTSRQPGLKTLYISGYSDSIVAGHGVLRPGLNLLHKPFTEQALLTKIREVLDGAERTLAESKVQP